MKKVKEANHGREIDHFPSVVETDGYKRNSIRLKKFGSLFNELYQIEH